MKPIIVNISSDLDGFDLYTLFKDEPYTALLDSGRDFESLGRYSFIGLNPFITIKSSGDMYWLNSKPYSGDVLEKLKEILKEYSCENFTELPFTAGGIGYLSYDFGRKFEVLPSISRDDLAVPELYFNFYDNIIVVDNFIKQIYITALGVLRKPEESAAEIENSIKKGSKVIYSEVKKKDKFFESNFTREEYMKTVEKLRNYIKSGDVYITNLTQRFNCKTDRKPYDVYKDLRYINPAPFAALLNFEDFNIVSSSPERFLRLSGDEIQTRPIKGTRPRGKTLEEDNLMRDELINSEKDRAELLMIVDLERNDLSRVCRPHSVKVTELFKLEEYSTVFHLVSTVMGQLKEGKSAIDCIKASFPGGSITGAPKIRSMEIIDELEAVRRNVYTGCIGYLSFGGNMDLNIAIRTIVMKDSKAYFGVGGGITYDSVPSAEYDETLDKAKALMRVL